MNVKKIISVALASFVFMSTSPLIRASEVAENEVNYTEATSTDSSISVRADVLKYCIRYNTDKGYYEYAIWNETRGYWVTEWAPL